MIHLEVLEEIDEGARCQVKFEYRFSPSDRWAIGEDYLDLRGYVEVMRTAIQGTLE